MRTKRLFAGAVAGALLLASCDTNVLPDPTNRAASLPKEADVAVGATHDVLIAACQDEVTLAQLFLPAVATVVFVGMGRLDAPFYLPGAYVHGLVPSCEQIPFTVSAAALDSGAFSLEATANPAAFRTHALAQGQARFTATVTVGGEPLQVSTTLRAWDVDRVRFSPVCDGPGGDPAARWVPAGRSMRFTHQLFHGTLELAGYGLPAVTSDRLAITEVGYSTASVSVAPIPGEFTLASALDPTYSETIRAYDATDVDSLTLARATGEPFVVGQRTGIVPRTTVGGMRPCVWGFPRQVTIETPTICRFEDRSDTWTLPNESDDEMSLGALAPGTCRVRVELPGTARVATLELTVLAGFEPVALPETLDLSEVMLGVWAPGPDDLFIVGYDEQGAGVLDGMIFRRVAGTWKPSVRLSHSGALRAVHGLPGGPVWAVGNHGVAARFDGAAWTLQPTGVDATLHGVWVGAADDVWAVGEGGTVVRWDGAAWSLVPIGTTAWLQAIWGPPGGDPVVVGGGRTMLWLTADGPRPVLSGGFDPAALDSPWAVAGASADDLWIADRDAAIHWDGVGWSTLTFSYGTYGGVDGVWPAGDGLAYFLESVEGKTYLLRYDGARTAPIPLTTGSADVPASAITGAGNAVWVLTRSGLYRYVHDAAAAFP